jgi:inosine triphosphate pyrophosphatase
MPLYVITGNKNKFEHIKYILPEAIQLDIDLPEIQELNPKKVIEAKLHEARKHHEGEFIVEDVSFSMECINGLPGPFIKWFLETIGAEGLANLAEKLGQQHATVTIHVGYVNHHGEIFYSEGYDKGIVVKPRGKAGFGWNPIFQPYGSDKTYAEIKETNPSFNTIRERAYKGILSYIHSR